jgi:hypothetical protein
LLFVKRNCRTKGDPVTGYGKFSPLLADAPSHDCRRNLGNVFLGQTECEELFVEFVCRKEQHTEFVCPLLKETIEAGATL